MVYVHVSQGRFSCQPLSLWLKVCKPLELEWSWSGGETCVPLVYMRINTSKVDVRMQSHAHQGPHHGRCRRSAAPEREATDGKLTLGSVCVVRVQKPNKKSHFRRFYFLLFILCKGHGLVCGGHLYFWILMIGITWNSFKNWEMAMID